MKFKSSIEIHKSREKVVQYFMDVDCLKEYQDGFINKDLVEGVAGENGSVSKMYYKQRNRNMIITETITNNKLPNSFEGHYHHIHMENTMKCIFIEISQDKTRYEYEFEYTRINWFFPKLISLLFPSIFNKQVEKWMKQFKVYVEKQ